MRFGLHLPNVGFDGDPRVLADLAGEAEAAGWDGAFVWDTVNVGPPDFPEPQPTIDVWIALAAMATCTQHLRLGPLVTPLSRRRPWNVARQAATLDRLAQGRLILPVGLGSVPDGGFCNVGEATDLKIRAERLDEALAILDGLWRAKPFRFEGTHFQVDEMTFLPAPVQRPRIPIWVWAPWPRPRPMRRALRWDGLFAFNMTREGRITEMTPAEIVELKAYVEEHRTATTPFDLIMESTMPNDPQEKSIDTIRAYAEAGVTWWLESVYKLVAPPAGSVEALRARIRNGPPQLG